MNTHTHTHTHTYTHTYTTMSLMICSVYKSSEGPETVPPEGEKLRKRKTNKKWWSM